MQGLSHPSSGKILAVQTVTIQGHHRKLHCDNVAMNPSVFDVHVNTSREALSCQASQLNTQSIHARDCQDIHCTDITMMQLSAEHNQLKLWQKSTQGSKQNIKLGLSVCCVVTSLINCRVRPTFVVLPVKQFSTAKKQRSATNRKKHSIGGQVDLVAQKS